LKLTVLFDLDGTLLATNEQLFIPAYFQSLSAKVWPQDPAGFGDQLFKATYTGMFTKDTPLKTLEESFDALFYPSIGIAKSEINPAIQSFYENEFARLKEITATLPEAAALIDAVIADGHQVVIATSPFFPRAATLQRLAWAGLPADQYSFSLVSTYEDFHFVKPNPAYYAELLAQLGWPEFPAVMIGNDMEQDIQPAELLGIPTFLVCDPADQTKTNKHLLSSHGSLAEVHAWLQQVSQQDFQNDFTTIEGMLAVLNATPAALETLVKDLENDLWSKRPDPSEWALNEILCHLRDVDREVNLPRIQRVLSEADAFIPGIETDSWAEEMDYIHQNGQNALQDFLKARLQIIDHLSKLPLSTWNKSLRHAIFGPTTFHELVSFIVTHDQNHVAQVKKTIQMLS